MLLVLKSNAEELGQEAARIVANAIRRNPRIRLGLATGSTTVSMYKELVRLHREESLDFSGIVTFNLESIGGAFSAIWTCIGRSFWFTFLTIAGPTRVSARIFRAGLWTS